MVVAAEIQDAQTAKEASGSDAVADSFGDADATPTAVTTVVQASKSVVSVVGAPKSLKQTISK